MDEMVAEFALVRSQGAAKAEMTEALVGSEHFLLPRLRWLGDDEEEHRGSITEALVRLRQVEDNALSQVALHFRYAEACDANPSYTLLGVSGWEMAEHELRLQEQWEEVMDKAWRRYLNTCATRNTEPDKEAWMAEMQFAFRPGLVG